jgi:hypothetical protein
MASTSEGPFSELAAASGYTGGSATLALRRLNHLADSLRFAKPQNNQEEVN